MFQASRLGENPETQGCFVNADPALQCALSCTIEAHTFRCIMTAETLVQPLLLCWVCAYSLLRKKAAAHVLITIQSYTSLAIILK